MNGSPSPFAMPIEIANPPKTIAVIDIGTNTILLLVANIFPDGSITPLVYEQRIPRLGRGVDARRRLQQDSMMRVVSVLREYRGIIVPFCPIRTVIIGTSAVRDAENREDFADLIHSETGFTLEILSGNDEAVWTYRGAISGIGGARAATVIDIGGGSTEITTGTAGVIASSCSLDIGSVRLSERFFAHDPPEVEELERVNEAIDAALVAIDPLPGLHSRLVAVAGTATTLALLAQGKMTFSLTDVSGVVITAHQIDRLVATLSCTPVAGILEFGRFMEGRADIITAGACILKRIMDRFGYEAVTVSERGVRYGIALREWERG